MDGTHRQAIHSCAVVQQCGGDTQVPLLAGDEQRGPSSCLHGGGGYRGERTAQHTSGTHEASTSSSNNSRRGGNPRQTIIMKGAPWGHPQRHHAPEGPPPLQHVPPGTQRTGQCVHWSPGGHTVNANTIHHHVHTTADSELSTRQCGWPVADQALHILLMGQHGTHLRVANRGASS